MFSSIKREHQLQLIALQMQLWDISAKLDMVTSNNSNFMKACVLCEPFDNLVGKNLVNLFFTSVCYRTGKNSH